MQESRNIEEYGANCQNENRTIGKSRDLTGQRFGKLTAIRPTNKRMDQGSVVWECICDCGKRREVSARRLVRGRVRSCGCLSNPPVKDYIGKRFGRLTVIEYLGRTNPNNTLNYWRCRCDCGNEVIVGQTELQNGETTSCGCYQKERFREGLRLIDGTSVTLLERSKYGIRSDNKSGYTGVYWDKRDRKWGAKFTFKKKNYWLGRYEDKLDAIKARQRAEEMRDQFLEWYYMEFKGISETSAQVSVIVQNGSEKLVLRDSVEKQAEMRDMAFSK